MAQSIESAITTIQGYVAALPGIKRAPVTIPENNAVFPFAIAYDMDGKLVQGSSSWGYLLSNIVVDFHVARQVLGIDIAKAYAMRTPFLTKLISNPTLGGAVESTEDISYVFHELKYAGTETIGYRWTIGVKITLVGT